ncbi:WD repeat-containing protein 91, variant 2 [Chamberlinius hualienensis]
MLFLVLPFVRVPEENPTFAMYFTRQWQDTIIVSLHNFLSVVFQNMPLPTLLSYEDEQQKISLLQDEIESLKAKLVSLNVKVDEEAQHSQTATDLMDDFCVIAQESAPTENHITNKSIRSIIRNISGGLPTSPILGRKQVSSSSSQLRKSVAEEAVALNRVSVAVTTTLVQQRAAESQLRKTAPTHVKDVKLEPARTPSHAVKKIDDDSNRTATIDEEEVAPFLLLSQEDYTEHHSTITHCKFNSTGSAVASSDMSGLVKIWSPNPSPHTIATVISKSSILALEWANKLERILLIGSKLGTIRLYDTKDKKTLCEVGFDGGNDSQLRQQRVTCLVSSPTESSFICCARETRSVLAVPGLDTSQLYTNKGRITVWDIRTAKLDKELFLESSAVVNNCVFNHNGQLLLIGASDGKLHMFDMRSHECITTWHAHQGSSYTVQFSADETSCYSAGEDNAFIQWSVNKTGQMISKFSLHDHAVGPFSIPVTTAGSNATKLHRPVGKIFASDAESGHIVTCGSGGGIIYSLAPDKNFSRVMALGGHYSPVSTVDWSAAVDCGTIITASVEGKIKVSTLLAQWKQTS